MDIKYKYNLCVTQLIDSPSGTIELSDNVRDENGNDIWFHCPDEALKMMYKLEEEEEDTDMVYSVVVDYWVDPYEK